MILAQVVQEALKHQTSEDHSDALSIAGTTPAQSQPNTPPMTPRGMPGQESSVGKLLVVSSIIGFESLVLLA